MKKTFEVSFRDGSVPSVRVEASYYEEEKSLLKFELTVMSPGMQAYRAHVAGFPVDAIRSVVVVSDVADRAGQED